MSVELRIVRDDECVLPNWLPLTSLTLEEIGAVFVLAAMNSGCLPEEDNEIQVLAKRFEDGNAAFTSLRQKGLMTAEVADGVLMLGIDLDKLTKP